jgi:NAD(P)-dependent dehydrogenase (short-subunit alcohol dehydrogenase family)
MNSRMGTALVIGASRGIGHEFVRQLRADGTRVLATARSDDGIAALKQLGAEALVLDVASADSVAALAEALANERIDFAIYVAGVYTESGAREAPGDDEFDRVMHTNVRGAMQVIPVVTPRVEAAAGTFAFVTSGMGSIGDLGSSFGWLYRVSKAALNMAVRAASFDYPDARMVVINPGWVKTEMGGADATLAVGDSVAMMRAALARLKPSETGVFVNFDGKRYPW